MAQSSLTRAIGTGAFRIVRRQALAGLTLTEALYPNEVIEPVHCHERAYFEIILKGAYTELEKGRTQEHSGLSLGFEPIKEPHSAHVHACGLHNLRVELQPEWLKRMDDGLPGPHSKCLNKASLFTSGSPLWLGMRLYDEWKRMDVLSSLAIEGLMLEVLAQMIRHLTPSRGPKPPRWLKEAVDLLHAEFTEPLTLEYIAGAVGVHPVYLARVFRQRHQCTVGEYIRRLRIEYACQQLAASDTPLTDIALAAGFADPSHFSKVFRRFVGLSPAAFRSRCSAAPRIEKIPVHPEP